MQGNSLTSLLIRHVYIALQEDSELSGKDVVTAFTAYRDYLRVSIANNEPRGQYFSAPVDRLLDRLEQAFNDRAELELDEMVLGAQFPSLNHFYLAAFDELLQAAEKSLETPEDFFVDLSEAIGPFIGSYDRKWLKEAHEIRITPNFVREIPQSLLEIRDNPDASEEAYSQALSDAVEGNPDDPFIAAQMVLNAEDHEVLMRAAKYLRPIKGFPAGKLGFYHDEELVDNWIAHCRVLLHEERDTEALPFAENLLRLGYDGPQMKTVLIALSTNQNGLTAAQRKKYPLLTEQLKEATAFTQSSLMATMMDAIDQGMGEEEMMSMLSQAIMGEVAEKPSAKVRSLPSSRKSNAVYRIKISLKGAKPPIWRRIELSINTPLEELHAIIQTVFEWTDSHLHAFQNSRRDSFVSPHDPYSQEWSESYEGMTIEDMFAVSGKKFTYHYDFGDSWYHEVMLEKELPVDKKVKYPRCTAGRCAAPLDDMGGLWGFYDLVEAIEDPKHEMYEDAVAYLGKGFNLKAFDREAIDKRLAGFR
ncbi:plasmid pRiA4b ORF-3 family protein [Neolewinella aurantiaca]|uniref:Plasmid pRiA4b ORF-3 family protein n=1 Tax=Neolewinella aurantiaca TaxID=2602767 RepID=A0A5C7FI25_9BACT|nr:plasmid pRiA4b ORF-3 family protein [Neolewinella aurantiaca]TXF90882.1 plasmid pRiA4b ORF-3 family protein [Neolewinella aurantiaca]